MTEGSSLVDFGDGAFVYMWITALFILRYADKLQMTDIIHAMISQVESLNSSQALYLINSLPSSTKFNSLNSVITEPANAFEASVQPEHLNFPIKLQQIKPLEIGVVKQCSFVTVKINFSFKGNCLHLNIKLI